jgi:hypothetical protein
VISWFSQTFVCFSRPTLERYAAAEAEVKLDLTKENAEKAAAAAVGKFDQAHSSLTVGLHTLNPVHP